MGLNCNIVFLPSVELELSELSEMYSSPELGARMGVLGTEGRGGDCHGPGNFQDDFL